MTVVLLSLILTNSSAFEVCTPTPDWSRDTSAMIQQADLERHSIAAKPLNNETNPRTLWTNVPVDLEALKKIAGLSSENFVQTMKSDYGVEVYSSKPSKSDLEAMIKKIPLQSSSSVSSISKLPDNAEDSKMSATQKLNADAEDPMVIKFVESFKTVAATGVYIPPGASIEGSNVQNTTNKSFMLFKECDDPRYCATLTTRVHEVLHHMIAQARVSLGMKSLRQLQDEEDSALAKLQRTGTSSKEHDQATLQYLEAKLENSIQSIGEELDAHRIPVDNQAMLNISSDFSGLKNARIAYQHELVHLEEEISKVRQQLSSIKSNSVQRLSLEKRISEAQIQIAEGHAWLESQSPHASPKLASAAK